MDNKIQLYLLTGFLGSGKTTFLQNILEEFKGQKIAVIQNEFGKIGIDGDIIRKDGMELVEINRGSIFCSCLQLQFAQALIDLGSKDIKYVFVESSGLADPSNIEEILEAVATKVNNIYEYKGALCIVDALNFESQLETLETVKRQLVHCNLAVVNKIDLVDENTKDTIEDIISSINPVIPINFCSFGKMNFDFINKDLLKYTYKEGEETTNSPDNKPKTLNMTYSGEVTKEKLSEFINIISKDCFRIKGFFKLEDGFYQVDAVNSKLDYKKIDTEREKSQLVFISKIGPKIIKPIFTAWENIASDSHEEMVLR